MKYNVKASVAGWGLNEKYKKPRNLKKLNVINLKRSNCEEIYGQAIGLNRKDSMCAHKKHNIGFGICFVSTFVYYLNFIKH